MRSAVATLQFSELLLVLLKGKTSLMDALHILARKDIEKPIRDSAASMLATMKKGKGFSEGLRNVNSGKVFFESLYLSLIASAELTGNIEIVLERIVSDLQRKQLAKENVINILIYPSIVVLLAIAGTILIIIVGMPAFISAGFLSPGVITDAKIGIAISGSVLLIGGGALFITYFRIFNYDSPEFKIFYLIDFLLQSNITLIESLSHCIVNMTNSKYGKILVNIKKDIASGISFSTAFTNAKCFSPYVLGWLSVAEMHGNLNDICGSIRDYYARKDIKRREAATKLIEPAVIILVGIYVFIIMITAVLPILTHAGGIL